MRVRMRLLLSVVAMLATNVAGADGGVLTFQAGAPSPTTSLVPDDYQVSTDSSPAEITLPGGHRVKGCLFSFDDGGGWFVFIAGSARLRLYCDYNRVLVWQPGENYPNTSFAVSRVQRYEHVRLPTDGTRELSLNLAGYSWGSYYHLMSVAVEGVYSGRLSVDGREYDARLGSAFHRGGKGAVLLDAVVLDSNRDGAFDPLTDEWFPAEGTVPVLGRLWTVGVTFSPATAEVSLAAFDGPTGTLAITGTDFLRAYVGSPPRPGVWGPQHPWFPIGGAADGRYPLPPGRYQLLAAWLNPASSEKAFLSASWGTPPVADVIVGGTASLRLGGPVSENLSLTRNYLLGCVEVSSEGIRNQAGYLYERVFRSGGGFASSPPGSRGAAGTCRVLDPQGKVVGTGSFDYG